MKVGVLELLQSTRTSFVMFFLQGKRSSRSVTVRLLKEIEMRGERVVGGSVGLRTLVYLCVRTCLSSLPFLFLIVSLGRSSRLVSLFCFG